MMINFKNCILFLFLIILQFSLSQPIRAEQQAKPIRIGVVLPLTGPLAWVGGAMRRGIELAAKETTLQPLELEFQDDLSSNRTVAVTAFRALTSVSHVDGILNCSTSTLAAVAPVINQTKTPTIILWDSNRDMPKFSPYVIGFGYANEKAAEDAADFLITKKQAQRIAVISYQNDWSELLTASFTARAKTLGATITLSEQVADSNTDLRSILLRAKQKQTQALYLPLYGLGLISAIRQAREIKFAGQILTVDSLGEQEMKETGPAAEGIYVSQIFLPYSQLTGQSTLRSLGDKTSGVDIGYTALGFDALTMLVKAVQSTKKPAHAPVHGEEIIKKIQGQPHQGELGKISINTQGIADRSIPILTVRNSAFTLVH
jgi:branched-chain amino acid transport system substrate-binding protein